MLLKCPPGATKDDLKHLAMSFKHAIKSDKRIIIINKDLRFKFVGARRRKYNAKR